MQARFGVDRAQAQRVSALAAQFHSALNHSCQRRDGKSSALGGAAARSRVCDFAQRLSQALGVSDSTQRHRGIFDVGPGACRHPGACAARQPEERCQQPLEDHQSAAGILSLRLAVILAHARRAVELPQWSLKFGKDNRARTGGRLADAASAYSISAGRGSRALGASRRRVRATSRVASCSTYTRSGLITARRTVVTVAVLVARLSHHTPPFLSDHSSARPLSNSLATRPNVG